MDLWLYTYGNGDFIYQIIISVNFFMSHARSFFQLAAMLSLLMFAAESTGVMPMRSGMNWTRFIKMYVVMAVFILTPYPGKVNVHDVINNEDRVVNMSNSQLPFGLIFPVATTSTIMYRLINLYQQNFEIDSNLSYTYSGMNFGANFIQSLDNADSYNDVFNRNFDQYMQNCGFPLMYKKGALSVLRGSSDIFTTLADPQYTSAARFVQQVHFDDPTVTSVTPCSQAIADINTYYNNNKDNILQNNARMMGVSSSTGYDRFINSANATANSLMGISQGASQALKQAIGMNMIMTSLKNQAQTNGNGSLALAAYDAEQFQSYKYGGLLNGAASARSVPILVGTAFAMLFFLYPIMIFLALMMGSYRAVGVFFQIVVAINLMPLIYEILNYMTTFYLQKKLGVTIQGQGYNYDVSTSLYSFTDNMITAGNWLASSTPILAYAIVTGAGTALTSVFGHINDPAKGAATKAGDELSHGNMNMGNTTMDNHSFNNLSGNKLDDQVTMNSGAIMQKTVTSGGTHTDINGNGWDINNKSDGLAHVNYTDSASKTLTNSLNQSHQDVSNIAKQWSTNTNRIKDLSNTKTSGTNTTDTIGSEDRIALNNAQELSKTIDGQMRASAKAGVSILGNGAGVEASAGISGRSSDTESLNQNLAKYKQYSEQLSHSSNAALRDAFSSGSSFADSTSSAVNDMVTKEKALSDVLSSSSSVTTNYDNDFNKYMHDQGLDPLQMTAGQQHEQAGNFVKSVIDKKYGLKTSLENPSEHLNSKKGGQVSRPDNSGINSVDTTPIDKTGHNKIDNTITQAQTKFKAQKKKNDAAVSQSNAALKKLGKDTPKY